MTHKEKCKEHKRQYYLDHQEEFLSKSAEYRATHVEQIRSSKAKYQQENQEKLRIKAAAYLAAHREENRQSCAAYAEAHREESRRRAKEYRERDLESARAKSRIYQTEHRAGRRAYLKAWHAANPDAKTASESKRRARKARSETNDLTAAQWRAIKQAFNNCCAYCGKPSQRLTQDHITPLSKGGAHSLHNVIPACRSCNSRKNVGPPLCQVQPLLLTAL